MPFRGQWRRENGALQEEVGRSGRVPRPEARMQDLRSVETGRSYTQGEGTGRVPGIIIPVAIWLRNILALVHGFEIWGL